MDFITDLYFKLTETRGTGAPATFSITPYFHPENCGRKQIVPDFSPTVLAKFLTLITQNLYECVQQHLRMLVV